MSSTLLATALGSAPAFADAEDLLLFLLGPAAVVAVGVPADPKRERRKLWIPSRVAPNELPVLVAQHLNGALAPREVHRERGGGPWIESRARWLGAYVIHRDENRRPICRWIVLDTDVKSADHARGLTQEDATRLALAVYEIADGAGLHPFLERSHSGKGWHVWVLFDRAVPAAFANWLSASIAAAAAKSVALVDVPESFPKQADPPTLGSLVALPLTGSPRGTDGGRLLDREGVALHIHAVRLSDPSHWVQRFAGVEQLRLIAATKEERRRTEWRVAGKESHRFDADVVSCEAVARAIAPHRITEETARELRMDCPRHASASRRSLGVQRDGAGWYCFGCAVGGGSYALAKWLLPDGTRHRAIVDALRFAAGVTA